MNTVKATDGTVTGILTIKRVGSETIEQHPFVGVVIVDQKCKEEQNGSHALDDD